jgi:hypothetical protein
MITVKCEKDRSKRIFASGGVTRWGRVVILLKSDEARDMNLFVPFDKNSGGFSGEN